MPSELDNKTEPNKVFGIKTCFFRLDLFKSIQHISSHTATNQNHPEDYLRRLPLRSSKDQGTIALSCTLANVCFHCIAPATLAFNKHEELHCNSNQCTQTHTLIKGIHHTIKCI